MTTRQAAEKGLRISVLAPEKSPIAELVLQQLGSCGTLNETTAAGNENVDLLVTTGAGFSAKTVRPPQFLILDATEANKKSLLSETGFHTSGDAWAYFVAKVGPGSFRVIELAKNDSVGVHKAQITPIGETQLLSAGLARSAAQPSVTRDRPDLAVEELVSQIIDHQMEAGKTVEQDIPPDVKKWTISYTLIKKGEIHDFGKTQNPSLSITYDIIAFLNNPPQGERYQYIYIRQKGVANPGVPMDYSTYYKGYGQFQVDTDIHPITHAADLVYDASSPPNVNDKRNITSKIGFSLEYTEKGGGGAKFNYEESITQEVFEWQIVERTNTSNMHWSFAERYPLNYLEMSCGAGNPDNYPFDYWDRVKYFPNLTRYALQPQTQSVWRTIKLLKEPVTFSAGITQSLRYFWYRFLWFECKPAFNGGSRDLIVDLSKVSE
jgi:hypothetical protein